MAGVVRPVRPSSENSGAEMYPVYSPDGAWIYLTVFGWLIRIFDAASNALLRGIARMAPVMVRFGHDWVLDAGAAERQLGIALDVEEVG